MSGQCLIVGGHHDGTWIDIAASTRFVQLPVIPTASAAGFEMAIYSRREFYCQGADWLVYAPVGDSDATLFERLLRGYRPAK